MTAIVLRNGISTKVVEGNLDHPQIAKLLQIHLIHDKANPTCYGAHALDPTGLKAPEVDFWAAWDGDKLLGFVALKSISSDHGEIKSMHVAAASRRLGVGSYLLRYVIGVARARGMRRLSLETGCQDGFHPARMLYHRHGFSESAPFGEYKPDPKSVFMSRSL